MDDKRRTVECRDPVDGNAVDFVVVVTDTAATLTVRGAAATLLVPEAFAAVTEKAYTDPLLSPRTLQVVAGAATEHVRSFAVDSVLLSAYAV